MEVDVAGSESCGDQCEINMGLIHLAAGDLVSAYRFFLPSAEAGDVEAISHLVAICERVGDEARALTWRGRLVTPSTAALEPFEHD